jgi:tight adherence protein C
MILLPGLALVVLIAIGAKGLAMIRDPGPAGRLTAADELRPAERLPHPGPFTQLVTAVSNRWGEALAGISRPKRRAKIRHLIDAAGEPGGLTLRKYVESKVRLTLIWAVVGLVLVLLGLPLLAPAVLLIAWLWPDVRLQEIARRRQAQLERDLPDFLDVLAVTVGAGVPFRPAVTRVCEGLGGPVGDEMMLALRQIDLGASSREALDEVRRRNDSESLREFIASVLQAEELGAPLAATLVDQAGDMRRSAHQRARRRAQRAEPRSSLVIALVIVPATVLLIATSIFIGSDVDFGTLFG